MLVPTAAIILLAACGKPARIRPPSSIVVVTIDTLRADHVNARLMPALDAVARESVVFEQTITVAPLTLPAHASLLTGEYPPRHRVRDNQLFSLPQDVPTYSSQLHERGYTTGAFVSAVVLDHRYGLSRGFDKYDDEIAGPERSADDTLARALRWLETARRPFFIWVHLFEPHAPYSTGSYAGEVTAVDRALSGFFKRLAEMKEWDDLVLSVTSDHGESLGEHGEQTHGFFVYDATLRIPWILKARGLAPRRVPQLVRIVDQIPTLLDVAGVEGKEPGKSPVDGVSVASLLRGGSLGLEAYSETFLPRDQFGWSALTSLRTAQFKYIDAPQPELYDLAADPGEARNVVAAREPDAVRLKRVLAAIARPPSGPSERAGSDPLLAEKMMALGYIGYSPASANMPHSTLPDPKAKLAVYVLIMKALEQSESADIAGALNSLEKAERLDASVAQIWFLKGTLLGQIGKYDDAATALQRTISLNPGYTAARFKLALAWLRTGRANRAEEALREVVRQQPDDFRAWHNLAAIAYSRADLEQADALERKALALSPEYAEAWNTLGAIALIEHRTDAALDALTKATQFGPENAQAFQNLSLALRAAGQPDRARAAAERACTLDKKLCGSVHRR